MIRIVIAMVLLAGIGLTQAQTVASAQGQTTQSFGKRVPTVDEVRRAFSPPPSSNALMGMGTGQRVKRAIELELLFGFASADLTPQARKQLEPVGEFLQSAQLGPGEFVIEGHTDASGDETRNLALSERRAVAVRNFLVSEFKLPANIFATAGKGSSILKDSGNPTADANRRVEFSVYVVE